MEQLNFFERAVKIVDKYGTFKVITSIVLFALFLLVTVGTPIITKYSMEKSIDAAEKNKELTHIRDLENRREVQPQIYSVLDNLLESTKADRAFIIELHNGSQNINGVPFLHGTVTYERVREGVENIDEEYQNLSLSRFESSIYMHNNLHFVGSVKDLAKIDKKIAAKLTSNQVSYVAVTTLHDGEKEWGWFGILYSEGSKIPPKEKMLNELLISSQTISGILVNVRK
jgi:hypothetical protein